LDEQVRVARVAVQFLRNRGIPLARRRQVLLELVKAPQYLGNILLDRGRAFHVCLQQLLVRRFLRQHLLRRFPRAIHLQVEIGQRGIRRQKYAQQRQDDASLEGKVAHVQIAEYSAVNSTVSGSAVGCDGVPACSSISFSSEKLLES